jgi:hypothetical protein
MTAIVLLARSAIRRRWRSILAISLLVGLTGTAVLAATAGAKPLTFASSGVGTGATVLLRNSDKVGM